MLIQQTPCDCALCRVGASPYAVPSAVCASLPAWPLKAYVERWAELNAVVFELKELGPTMWRGRGLFVQFRNHAGMSSATLYDSYSNERSAEALYDLVKL